MPNEDKKREPLKGPPTFKDKADRPWTIDLQLELTDRIVANCQVDLIPDDNDPSAVTGLLFSRKKLGAVLWECIQEQAVSKDVDRKSFLAQMDGPALTRGWGALVDGIVFFIQTASPKVAEQIEQLIEAQMRVIEAGASQIVETVKSEETNQAIQQAVEEIGKELKNEIRQGLAKSATSSPESSVSIRDRFRSVG